MSNITGNGRCVWGMPKAFKTLEWEFFSVHIARLHLTGAAITREGKPYDSCCDPNLHNQPVSYRRIILKECQKLSKSNSKEAENLLTIYGRTKIVQSKSKWHASFCKISANDCVKQVQRMNLKVHCCLPWLHYVFWQKKHKPKT